MPVTFASIPSDSVESQESLPSPRNVAELLVLAARLYPTSGIRLVSADCDEDAPLVTYPDLLNDARRILAGLRAQKYAAGSNVALLLERSGDFIPALWACLIGGYVPCPLAPLRNSPEHWLKHITHVLKLLDDPIVVATGTLLPELPNAVSAIDLLTLRAGKPQRMHLEAQLRDPAILMLTSGSTGNSKAVVLTHGNLLASLAGKASRQELRSDDVMLNWIAFDHVAALLESHMIALYVGAMQLHAEPATVLADPLRFLRLIGKHGVSIAFAPNFLLGQINAMLQPTTQGSSPVPPLTLDLSRLRRIVTGGEANVVETGRRFLNLLAPYGLAQNALWPAFGMTETCAASVYSNEFPELDLDREFAAVGRPIKGMEIRIVGEDGARLPAGQSGELQLHGPIVFRRYYNNDEATRNAFTEDGWFRTGDLGVIREGRLSLIGRSKDCIIVSGVNYFSHELEATLEQLDGVERSFVVAFPTRPKGADTEQLVVAFATSFSLEQENEVYRVMVAIRNATISLWGFRPLLVLPLPRSAFPKTSLGKIQRSVMRKRLEAGIWATWGAHVAEMTARQLGGYAKPEGAEEAAIAQIFAEIFNLDPADVSATASFFDLGGTSLDIIRLKQQLAHRMGRVDLPMVSILQNPTVRGLARQDERQYEPIVALQTTGSKTPLFCIHPATGEVLVFVSLANYFVNERPFYTLRARGFGKGERYFESIDEMVHTYADAIRKQQPRGPYAIAGYSFGGPIAFEVAKVLESSGERVAFCGSIDGTVFIGDRNHKLNEIESAFRVAYFLGMVDMEQMLQSPERLLAMTPVPDPYETIMQLASPKRLAELDLNLAKFTAWAKLSFWLVTMGQEYVPAGSVEATTVFYAKPLWGTKEDWINDRLQEWNNHSRRPPRYVEVAGTHSSLLERDHVATFQAVLRAEINRSLEGN